MPAKGFGLQRGCFGEVSLSESLGVFFYPLLDFITLLINIVIILVLRSTIQHRDTSNGNMIYVVHFCHYSLFGNEQRGILATVPRADDNNSVSAACSKCAPRCMVLKAFSLFSSLPSHLSYLPNGGRQL